MAAILIDIKPGDEVIVPSYTFVSTALAFQRQGAKIIFTDSLPNHPNMDVAKVEALITKNTKAIIPVHYAGVAVDMGRLMDIATKHDIFVIEDAAQAVDSYYNDRALGSIGHLGAFSFHETKNIISGEGGLLSINDERFVERAEVIWEKGTNRASFFRGEVNKYGWVDSGSSFLPSETTAAFLWAQLEKLQNIQEKRKQHWLQYDNGLQELKDKHNIILPIIPDFATNNAHMYYLVCSSSEERGDLIGYLKKKGIHSVFHYLSLHKSEFHLKNNPLVDLPNADIYTDRLVRLPMYFELSDLDIQQVIQSIIKFYNE
jgi:dTDP-4-amino-4,6-dideoxygalactose transaminase